MVRRRGPPRGLGGPTGENCGSVRIAHRWARVSPQRAGERKRPGAGVCCAEGLGRAEDLGHAVMALTEAAPRVAMRGLPGATVLQIIPALEESAAARAAVDLAGALLRSGARVIVASEDGPLNSELQGLGGEWTRLVTDTANPLAVSRNGRTIANLVSTERVDLVHALGIGASRSAATLKKRAGVWVVHTYDAEDLNRESRDKSYSRALLAGDRIIVPSHYVADQIMTRHQVPREKLAVIPRRIDAVRFDPPAISPERAMVLRRGWKIGRGQRLILVPGRIDPAKGQLLLVEAARILTNGGLKNVIFVLENRAWPAACSRAGPHRSRQGPAPACGSGTHPDEWRAEERDLRARRG